MGRGTVLRFGLMAGPATTRVLLATRDPKLLGPLAEGLRSDGHDVLRVAGPTEFIFALEVMKSGAGPTPQWAIIDSSVGVDVVANVFEEYGRLLQSVLVILMVDGDESALTLPAGVVMPTVVAVTRKPADLDDLRTALVNPSWMTAVGKSSPVSEVRPVSGQVLQDRRPISSKSALQGTSERSSQVASQDSKEVSSQDSNPMATKNSGQESSEPLPPTPAFMTRGT